MNCIENYNGICNVAGIPCEYVDCCNESYVYVDKYQLEKYKKELINERNNEVEE